jgi:hypothetical protein
MKQKVYFHLHIVNLQSDFISKQTDPWIYCTVRGMEVSVSRGFTVFAKNVFILIKQIYKYMII